MADARTSQEADARSTRETVRLADDPAPAAVPPSLPEGPPKYEAASPRRHRMTRASLVDETQSPHMATESPRRHREEAARVHRTAAPSSPHASRLSAYQHAASRAVGGAGSPGPATATPPSDTSSAGRLGLYLPRASVPRDRLAAVQRRHLMSSASTAGGGEGEDPEGRLPPAEEAAVFGAGAEVRAEGAALGVGVGEATGSVTSAQVAAADSISLRSPAPPSEVPELRPDAASVARLREQDRLRRELLARPLNRLDMHVDGVTDGFPTPSRDKRGGGSTSGGEEEGQEEEEEAARRRRAAAQLLHRSRDASSGASSASGHGLRGLSASGALRVDPPPPASPLARLAGAATADQPAGRHADSSPTGRPGAAGPVTSPAVRKVIAEAGAEQPLPRFRRREAEALDAVLQAAMAAHGAVAVGRALHSTGGSRRSEGTESKEEEAEGRDVFDLEAFAAAHGVSAHRLRLRALTRELAGLEGQLDEERNRLEADAGDFDGLATALKDQLRLLDALRRDSGVLEKVPPEAMLTVARAAEEAVSAVASAAESMGFTTADIRASVRSAESACEEARARQDVLRGQLGGGAAPARSIFSELAAGGGASDAMGSNAGTGGSGETEGLASTGPAPEIHTNPALEFLTEPTGEGAWRVTTRITRKVQRVRLSPEGPSKSGSRAPAAALAPSDDASAAASTAHSAGSRALRVQAAEDTTEVRGPDIEGALPSGPEHWVLRS